MKHFYSIVLTICCSIFFGCLGGRIVTDGFVSQFLGVSPDNPTPEDCKRLFNVYLPDEFDLNPEQTFPIVYHLTGFGGNYTTYSETDKEVMDMMLAEKQIMPLIIVAPDPRDLTYSGNYYVNSILNGQFESYFIQELIPYVDAKYRQKRASPGDPNSSVFFRALMGQSMGGYGSLYYGIKYPELFIAYAGDSPTPFWTLTTTIANPPTTGNPPYATNNMYSFTKLFTEIVPLPPDGAIRPTNDPTTFLFFAWASAFSPITAGPPLCFIGDVPCTNAPPYCVDLPFQVTADSVPLRDANGVFIARQNILDLWNTFDPYFILPTKDLTRIRRQAIFLDAGADVVTEPIANVGARYFSDRLTSFNINNEFILFDGGHTTCTTPDMLECYRFTTNLKLFSGKFAQAGVFTPEILSKIVGTMTIELTDNTMMTLLNKNITGIETDPANGITATNITLRILDSAQLLIGTDTEIGGGLQVGNNFGKANILFNPSLATNTIAFTLELNGPEAVFRIGRQGYLGFGVGIQGNQTAVANYWSLSTLANVTDVRLSLLQGKFFHNQIASSLDARGALMAIGESLRYNFSINSTSAVLSGGANLATISQGNLIHPTVQDRAGVILPGGIRSKTIIVPDPNQLFDTFYGPPNGFMGSTTFELNDMAVSTLSSSAMLFDNRKPPLPLNASRLEFYNFLATDPYLAQGTKRASLQDINGMLLVEYIATDGQNNQLINRPAVPQTGACLPFSKAFDKQRILDEGAVGIKLATISGKQAIIRLYDLDPIIA